MSQFPKWKYHENRDSKIVDSLEQEQALGDKWFDTPREAGWLGQAERDKPKPQAPKPESEQLKELREQNQFLFDENKRLQAALDESDTYIETLQKALEEAQKNDLRDDDGKFTSKPPADPAPAPQPEPEPAPAGEDAAEGEGEANDEAPAEGDDPAAGDAPEEGEAKEEAPAPAAKSKKKK